MTFSLKYFISSHMNLFGTKMLFHNPFPYSTHTCKRYLFRVQISTLHMFFRLYLPPGSGRLRQPATVYPTLDLCTRYPLRLGGPRQCGIRSLPDTSTYGQHWESNPRPSDLGSNALSTWPHAPTYSFTHSHNYLFFV